MQNITQKDKQIEIARFCKWSGFCGWIYDERIIAGWHPSLRESTGVPLPDYFGSLDAIHCAQKYLHDDMWPEYWDHLSDITGAEKESSWGKFYTDPKALLNATAANHAEAFYRTISNLKEDEESAENS